MENPGRKISEPLSGFPFGGTMRQTIKLLLWVLTMVIVGSVILSEVIR